MPESRYVCYTLLLLYQFSVSAQPATESRMQGNSTNPLYLSMLLNFILLAGGLGFFYMQRKKLSLQHADADDFFDKAKTSFDPSERSVIIKILNCPAHELSLSEVDNLIGTGAKSIHHQNRKRSVLIRSINEKYANLTKDKSPLITSVRIKDDRRMHRYKIDAGRFEKVRPLLAD